MIFTPSLRGALVVAAGIFALDRASKIWIVEHLDLPQQGRIEVFDPWLNLVMAWNHGVNFGLFDLGPDGRYWLSGVAILIVLGLAVWMRRRSGPAIVLGGGAVIGGALGNVWDRLQWGAVADFVNMSCCGIRNPFAFNIADAAIFGGALLLVLFAEPAAPRSRRRRRNTS